VKIIPAAKMPLAAESASRNRLSKKVFMASQTHYCHCRFPDSLHGSGGGRLDFVAIAAGKKSMANLSCWRWSKRADQHRQPDRRPASAVAPAWVCR
jgi:hypothetical protein